MTIQPASIALPPLPPSSNSKKEECPICKEEDLPENLVQVVHETNQAFHSFHIDCLTPWIKTQKRGDCPYCRDHIISVTRFGVPLPHLEASLKVLSFYQAVRSGNLQEMNSYFRSGALTQEIGREALVLAAEAGQVEALQALIQNAPLHLADCFIALQRAQSTGQGASADFLTFETQARLQAINMAVPGSMEPQEEEVNVPPSQRRRWRVVGFLCSLASAVVMISILSAKNLNPIDPNPIGNATSPLG